MAESRSLATLAPEYRPRVPDQHLVQVVAGHPGGPQRGHDHGRDVAYRQSRSPFSAAGRRRSSRRARAPAATRTPGGQRRRRFHPGVVTGAEPVHAEVRARHDQLLQVGEVGGVAGVPDDHPRQVDALLAEDPCWIRPVSGRGSVWVESARRCGAARGPRHAARSPRPGSAPAVGAALQDRRADPRFPDALGDSSRTNRSSRKPGPLYRQLAAK